MQRRQLLKGLAAMSLVSVASQIGCSKTKNERLLKGPKDSFGRLNIVLHGMFAVVLNTKNPANKSAWLLAPKVSDHLYGFGIADRTVSSDIEWLWQARVEGGQRSEIVIPGRNPATGNLPAQLDLMLDWNRSRISQLAKTEHWNIALPMPDGVWAFRPYQGNPLATNGNTYSWNSLAIAQVPTVLILTYYPVDVDPRNAPLYKDLSTGSSRPIPLSANDNVARLHLFAESPFGNNKASLNMALNELNDLFRDSNNKTALDLSIGGGYSNVPVPVDNSSTQPSVLICEERNLGELEIPCGLLAKFSAASARAATRVHNCMSVVVSVAG